MILGMSVGWECICAMSWGDLGLTCDLSLVILTNKYFLGLNMGNRKVQEVDTS